MRPMRLSVRLVKDGDLMDYNDRRMHLMTHFYIMSMLRTRGTKSLSLHTPSSLLLDEAQGKLYQPRCLGVYYIEENKNPPYVFMQN
jgi:hypothetical protein